MVIYEVNIRIDNEIYQEYYDWLIPHIKTMLLHEGFVGATLLKDESNEKILTVAYQIQSRKHLQHYLDHHASRMREDALQKFNGKFSITRRILEVTAEFHP